MKKIRTPSTVVTIGKLRLANPLIAASGTFGEEYAPLVKPDAFGALIAKTITLESRTGNPPPRVAETASGMLNSIGLENGGVDYFLEHKLPFFAKLRVPCIVSVAGDDASDFAALVKRLDKIHAASAFELNLSCPNIRYGNRHNLIAQDPRATRDVVSSVRRSTKKTIIVKLTPNIIDITEIAIAAADAGADALTVANTFLGMAVDIETCRPKIGNVVGGLSGPAIKPLALRLVWAARQAVRIPIIGSGGIMTAEDALEFLICGATAVQLGTTTFVDPQSAATILSGIKQYLVKHDIGDINRLIGSLETARRQDGYA